MFEETVAQGAQNLPVVESPGKSFFDPSLVGIGERTGSIGRVSCWNMAKDLSFVSLGKWTGLNGLRQLVVSWKGKAEGREELTKSDHGWVREGGLADAFLLVECLARAMMIWNEILPVR